MNLKYVNKRKFFFTVVVCHFSQFWYPDGFSPKLIEKEFMAEFFNKKDLPFLEFKEIGFIRQNSNTNSPSLRKMRKLMYYKRLKFEKDVFILEKIRLKF
jgi:hypothetical protein